MKFLETTSLELVLSIDRPTSSYAIFSHAWGDLFDELTPADASHLSLAAVTETQRQGCRKATALHHIAQACRQAKAQNVRYLWVHSLCIDKSSPVGEAEFVITSFSLIWDAALTITYLPELAPSSSPSSDASTTPAHELESAFANCRWFTRAWTLQELVASRRVEFFDRDWCLRATKHSNSPRSWLTILSRISHVDVRVLSDRNTLVDVSLGRRISWAAHRSTSRPEDAAYSLLGICGIQGQLNPRYGEGARSAFHRLQERILMTTNDLSILAWKTSHSDDGNSNTNRQLEPPLFSGIFADSTTNFLHFASESSWEAPFSPDCELAFSNRGLCVQGLLAVSNYQLGLGHAFVLLLNASWRSQVGSMLVGIRIKETEPGLFIRTSPNEVVCFPKGHEKVKQGRVCLRRDASEALARYSLADSKRLRVTAWMKGISAYVSQMQEPVTKQDGITDHAATNTGTHRAAGDYAEVPLKRGLQELEQLDLCMSQCSSGEDDVLLFDSLPEKPERLEDGHHLLAFVPQLVNLGLSAWKEQGEEEMAGATRHKTGLIPVNGVQQRPTSTSASHPPWPRKRARKECREQEPHGRAESSEENCSAYTDEEDPERLVVRIKDCTHPKTLACPFYKFDPVCYRSCLWELELPDVRTIKQHVIVDHRRPYHCPICRTLFERAVDRDQHVVARCCSLCQSRAVPVIGVTEDDVQKLSQRSRGDSSRMKRKRGDIENSNDEAVNEGRRKAPSANNEEEEVEEVKNWLQVWEILFPDVPPPQSPYLLKTLEQKVLSLRSFWNKCGPELVSGELEKHNLLRWEDLREEATLAALHASVLRAMVETYVNLAPEKRDNID